MFKRLMLLPAVLCLLIFAAVAQAGSDPYIGYVYPAGGQCGSHFQVIIGGQRLKNVNEGLISGGGVHVRIVKYESASGPLNSAQKEELRRRINEIRLKKFNKNNNVNNTLSQNAKNLLACSSTNNKSNETITLPDLPDLRNLDEKSKDQLKKIENKYLNNSKRTKPPIAEKVTLDVSIDADAAVGEREIRLLTPSGLSNPMVFEISSIKEISEPASDDDEKPSEPVVLQSPVVINGRIMPGEIDSYPLHLHAGEQVKISALARHLVPYLADAVPGWFQALLTICDENGRELASADHYYYDPDPVFRFKAKNDGIYNLSICDALYRGREDFIYRVTVDKDQPDADLFNKSAKSYTQFVSSDTSEEDEIEPNDTPKQAQKAVLPKILRGCIAHTGDVDIYKFYGHAGDDIAVETYARRLNSPLDSLLKLTTASGHVIALNDDHENAEMGLITDQADSYISAKLPATGIYFVQVSDAQNHGGADYKYYLRISQKQPDFALRAVPSAINVRAKGSVAITVYAFRKDGWNGDIVISLKNAPSGVKLSGKIPAGKDSAAISLTAPKKGFNQPVVVQLEGSAVINGKTIIRPVIPSDNKMQAFAYTHLVPAKQFMLMITSGKRNWELRPSKKSK